MLKNMDISDRNIFPSSWSQSLLRQHFEFFQRQNCELTNWNACMLQLFSKPRVCWGSILNFSKGKIANSPIEMNVCFSYSANRPKHCSAFLFLNSHWTHASIIQQRLFLPYSWNFPLSLRIGTTEWHWQKSTVSFTNHPFNCAGSQSACACVPWMVRTVITHPSFVSRFPALKRLRLPRGCYKNLHEIHSPDRLASCCLQP